MGTGNDTILIHEEKTTGNAYGVEGGYGMMPPEFSLTSASAPTKESALERHQQNTNMVSDVLKEMKNSSKAIEMNTAEWFTSNAMPFYVATKTHDSPERAKNLMKNDDYFAYFGEVDSGKTFPNPSATYADDVKDYNGCNMIPKSTNARVVHGNLSIYDPIARGQSKNAIKELLIHEVQHLADQHEEEEIHDSPDNVDDAWTGYKTEFRSYWVSGKYDHLSETSPGNFKMSPKQSAIYTHIFTAYPYVQQFLKDVVTKSANGDDNGKTLMSLIYNYQKPEGVNLENSLRIENLNNALEQCDNSMGLDDDEVKGLLETCKALKEDEKASIFNDPNKAPIKEKLQNELSAEVYREVFQIISNIYL